MLVASENNVIWHTLIGCKSLENIFCWNSCVCWAETVEVIHFIKGSQQNSQFLEKNSSGIRGDLPLILSSELVGGLKGKFKAHYKNTRIKCLFFWPKSNLIWKISSKLFFWNNNVGLFDWYIFNVLSELN